MTGRNGSCELDTTFRPERLLPRASLGPKALAQIGLQRVRGLDHEAWGRPLAILTLIMTSCFLEQVNTSEV